jgi:ABC-type cobalamin/Fe3+-siderophores transport system ATPase subunit
MNDSIEAFIHSLPEGLSFSVLVGENGAGKSRALRELAKRFICSGRQVVAISNTPYDRFANIRGLKKVTYRSNAPSVPERLIKSTLVEAWDRSPVALKNISETLGYLNLRPRVGLRITGKKPRIVRGFTGAAARSDDLQLDQDSEWLVDLLERRFKSGETEWLDFSSRTFAGLVEDQLLAVLKYENELKRAGFLRKVSIFLEDADGVKIDVRDASSGQLMLLASRVFLASQVRQNACILIDEPENSLHPRWQKDYVERLAWLLKYPQPSVVIATHSPMILSDSTRLEHMGVRTHVHKVDRMSLSEAFGSEQNIEQLYAEIFGVVTPENHYVSVEVASVFGQLDRGEIAPNAALELIGKLEKKSFDSRQSDFFESVRELLRGTF